MTSTVIAIAAAIFGSTGFWTLIQFIIQKKLDKDSKQSRMIKGLGHDRICNLAGKYIEAGYISKEEYEDLHDYLYAPYKELGGNGTAERLMKEVEKLPIKEVRQNVN